jgi:GNAT superfamily N-acetyltransferase
VEPFASSDQLEVRGLILSYLADRFGALDPTLKPDLDDIAASYTNGHVLVARLDGRVAGTGILVPQADGSAEIKRMCVARDVRRRGVGSRILHALIEQAGRDGVRRIVVYTATAWADAVSFYSGAGFMVSRYEQTEFTFDAVFTLAL